MPRLTTVSRFVALGGAAAVVLAASAGDVAQARPGGAASCEALSKIALPHTTITRAQFVPAGQFAGTPEGLLAPGATAFKPYSALPAFCRVAATLAPSADSDIKVELWMPADTWNGKFEALGNGGWAGQLSVQPLAVAVGRGYAAATTDTGHATPGAAFAFNHPEKLVDFAWRAVHEMTIQSKALLQAFYAKAPEHAYWNGCSTGGRQGLKEAQRFPADYDGIIAGAPANNMTHLLSASIWIAQASLDHPASYIPPAKYALVHRAVLDACDAIDGVTDGVLDDPRRCHFDPATLQCRSGDAAHCLTAPQVETARKIYGGAVNPRTGAAIYPGLEPGSEMGWSGLAGPQPLSIADDYFKYIVFKDPAWDFRTLDFDTGVAKADALDHGEMNAMDPDLGAYLARGGKLLLYHGWNDQLIAPENTVQYYEAVVRTVGPRGAADAVRLFMEPGATHCAGGDGPSNFDPLGVLDSWVAGHTPPDRIVATHLSAGAVDRSRPLCPYPQVATYRGTGSTNDAANFTCAAAR